MLGELNGYQHIIIKPSNLCQNFEVWLHDCLFMRRINSKQTECGMAFVFNFQCLLFYVFSCVLVLCILPLTIALSFLTPFPEL